MALPLVVTSGTDLLKRNDGHTLKDKTSSSGRFQFAPSAGKMTPEPTGVERDRRACSDLLSAMDGYSPSNNAVDR
jgi:hypothetical protein